MVDAGTEILGAGALQLRAEHYRGRYEDHLKREARRDAERRERLAARSIGGDSP
jgi:hypothetical protein